MSKYKMIGLINFLILLVCLPLVSCDTICNHAKTCGECIGIADRCVWCEKDDYPRDEPRCKPFSEYEKDKSWCVNFVNDPQFSVKVTVNENFKPSDEKNPKTVQIKPQEMTISRARPGVSIPFEISVKRALNYPIDVYYLMDFSYTMRKYFQTLKNQGQNVYRRLSNFTNNVRLGLGSFVEKPGLPFSDPKLHKAYTFENHLSLTEKIDVYNEVVGKINYTGGSNYDLPEATLYALMQVMTCKKDLNWRNDSNRIIVVSTDNTYHSAGDGKFIGAPIPNDMQCHTPPDDYSVLLDYPSVSQVRKVANDNNFIIMFAVLKNTVDVYQVLSKEIKLASCTELKADNLVELIVAKYLESVSNVTLDITAPPNIKVELDPDCTLSNPKNVCGIEHDQNKTITGKITLQNCEGEGREEYVRIRFVDEYLTIKVETDCKCDCERPGKGIPNSDKCHGGLEQCSACTNCTENRYGTFCQCTGDGIDEYEETKCKMTNDTEVCNGLGTCKCGSCKCNNEKLHGKFCEYNGEECDRPDGVLCSGHGICRYGKCRCNPGWKSKSDCSCPDDEKLCKAKGDDKVCSGSGHCECGKCVCDILPTNETFAGKFCECAPRECKDIEKYVLCKYNNETDCEKDDIGEADIEFVNKTDFNSPLWSFAKFCKLELEDDSSIHFKHHCQDVYGLSKLHFVVQKEKEVPTKLNIWIPIGVTIGLIILIGLLTILAWKVLVNMYDAREYSKFEKESLDAGFDVNINPHHLSPTMNYENPVYNRDNM